MTHLSTLPTIPPVTQYAFFNMGCNAPYKHFQAGDLSFLDYVRILLTTLPRWPIICRLFQRPWRTAERDIAEIDIHLGQNLFSCPGFSCSKAKHYTTANIYLGLAYMPRAMQGLDLHERVQLLNIIRGKVVVTNMALGVTLLIFESWLHHSPPNGLCLLAYQI